MAGEVKLTQAEVEEQFRESLRDVVLVGEKLASHCGSVDEFLGVCKLALDNDGQLRLLYSLMASQNKK